MVALGLAHAAAGMPHIHGEWAAVAVGFAMLVAVVGLFSGKGVR